MLLFRQTHHGVGSIDLVGEALIAGVANHDNVSVASTGENITEKISPEHANTYDAHNGIVIASQLFCIKFHCSSGAFDDWIQNGENRLSSILISTDISSGPLDDDFVVIQISRC